LVTLNVVYEETIFIYVPFGEADKATRRAFKKAGERLGIWTGAVPEHWHCQRCGGDVERRNLVLDYRSFPGLPLCATPGCGGVGWEALRPAA